MAGLGDEVKDTVSGYKGIVVAIHTYLNGCARMTVQPKIKKDGTLPQPETFDEPQLEVLKEGKVKIGARDTGGPDKFEDLGRSEG